MEGRDRLYSTVGRVSEGRECKVSASIDGTFVPMFAGGRVVATNVCGMLLQLHVCVCVCDSVCVCV